MDYYQSAWQLYLVVSVFISILVFLIIKPLPIMYRSVLQGLALAVLFVPVGVTVEGSETLAPITAKLVVDLIAGNFEFSAFLLPLVLVFLATALCAVALYNSFLFCQRRKPVEE